MGWLIIFSLIAALPIVVAAALLILLRPVPGPPAGGDVDPFDALHLQSRLGALADELVRLELDSGVYARAARIRAARAAYDDLLAEALDLAGLDPCRFQGLREGGRPAALTSARLSAELELASRGWSW